MSFVLLLIVTVLVFVFATGFATAAILKRRSSAMLERSDELESLRADVANLYDEFDRLRELVERANRGGNPPDDAVKAKSP